MDERMQEVTGQYEIDVYRTYRARGAFILETRQGLYLYKAYTASNARAEYEASLQSFLVEQNFTLVDQYKKNRDGAYISKDSMGDSYIIKNWFLGEECNLYKEEEVMLAVKTLATMHNYLKGAAKEIKDSPSFREVGAEEAMDRHLREIQRVRTYIRNKKEKNLFEVKLLGCMDQFYKQALNALTFFKENTCEAVFVEAKKRGDVYHGNYTYHHLLVFKEKLAVVQFEKAGTGCQIRDLYYFLRKLMEKNSWNIALGKKVIQTYEETRGLSIEELQALYAMMWFPEKFWKIANAYYNSKKSRLPGRNLGKLEDFLKEEGNREMFLQWLGQKSILKT